MQIAVIGAGLAGLACATSLMQAGHRVSLFDKGRGAGGRMSTRRVQTALGEAGFDHGAQYMTARDPGFQTQLQRWSDAGLAAPWPAAGADAWVGTPTMNAPLRRLAANLDVAWASRIAALEQGRDGWRLHGNDIDAGPFDVAIVALPAEQAATLLGPVDSVLAQRAADTPTQPCLTAMAAFAERLPIAADVLQHRGAIGWAARNSAKPGRSGPESWVVQATPDWSVAHLEDDPSRVLTDLLALFAMELGVPLPVPLTASTHRWRYARSGNAGDGLFWDAGRRLGVCGDWLLGPGVECAWLSGTRLAGAIRVGTIPASGR